MPDERKKEGKGEKGYSKQDGQTYSVFCDPFLCPSPKTQ